MKILVISQEVWQDGTNGGNVLSNLFYGLNYEIAQIYCSPGLPNNNLCKKYYQMTDSMIISGIINNRLIGKSFELETSMTSILANSNKTISINYEFFRRFRFESFILIKELFWATSKWKNNLLREFVLDYNPDIIFAPCYGSHAMLALDRYVKEIANKPVISYISDDHYSLKQFRFSPLYWINRLYLRKNIKKTFSIYDLTYCMTEEQIAEINKSFSANMKILRKSIDVSDLKNKQNLNKPIRLIYAGGLYCGRWKTLAKIVDAMKLINTTEDRISLDIYTGSQLTANQRKLLSDGKYSRIHGLISQEELKECYSESDIALHVESFDLKNRYLTRLSFSTKIIDCLSSGCAVIAIAWKNHSGLKYLSKEDAAICVNKPKDIYHTLSLIVENPSLVNEYANKAVDACKRNHDRIEINKMIRTDIAKLVQAGKNENLTN